jgi:hypothetical protein
MIQKPLFNFSPMSGYMILKTVETPTMQASLGSDDIVRVLLKKNSEIDASGSMENIQAYIDLTNNSKYAFIVSAEDGSIIYTEEARKNARKNEKLFEKICMAIIVKTLAHRLVANFYLKFYKPAFPFKVFDKPAAAEAWCKVMLTKEKSSDLHSNSEMDKC